MHHWPKGGGLWHYTCDLLTIGWYNSVNYFKSPGYRCFKITALLLFLSLVIFTVAAVVTNGESIKFMFFSDQYDTFMDHFNSTICAHDHPYTKYNVTYPPLIVCIYKVIANFTIPYVLDYGSLEYRYAVRASLMPMIIFIVIVIVMALLFYFTIRFYLKDHLSEKQTMALFFLLLLSYPTLFGIERGNCIFLSLLFLFYYVVGHNSDNKCIRLLSYLALGVATGVKIFPAIFAIITLKHRGVKEFLTCFIIVSCVLLIPFIFTDGTPISVFNEMIHFSSTHNVVQGYVNISDYMTLINASPREDTCVNAFVASIGIIFVLFDKTMKAWEETLILSSLLILTFSVTGMYLFLYLQIPLLLMMAEKNPDKSLYLPLICIILVMMVFPGFVEGDQRIATYKSVVTIVLFCISIASSIVRFTKNRQRITTFSES